MSKIIQVINTMIINSDKISNVIISKNTKEYFFLYSNKFKWSITEGVIEDVKQIILYLYPQNDITLGELAKISDFIEYTNYIVYKSSEFKSVEATESFNELLNIVKNKIYGVDEILDTILKE